MSLLRFVSHPQVRIDGDVPVPRWGLTDEGRRRVEAIAGQSWSTSVTRLVASTETKALETAAVIAQACGVSIEVRAELRENDRSSTGFVDSTRFEQLANAFFAAPDTSIEGWETSSDAQHRIVAATEDLRGDGDADGDIVISGHGGTGTLLLCHLLGVAICRDHDQNRLPAAPGGGNHWAFDRSTQRVVHGWRPIEELATSR